MFIYPYVLPILLLLSRSSFCFFKFLFYSLLFSSLDTVVFSSVLSFMKVVLLPPWLWSRAHWPLGRVTKSYLGKDAVVRVIDTRVGGKVYKGSVHRLVPLEV